MPRKVENHLPAKDWILVKLEEEQEETTRGGLYIPNENKESNVGKMDYGTIVACGDEVSEETAKKIGTLCTFSTHVGKKVGSTNTHRLIRDMDIIAFYVEEDSSQEESENIEFYD